MAASHKFVTQVGTEIVIAGPSGFSPADTGTRWSQDTTVDFNITVGGGGTGLANDAARQSAKIDLGADRAPFYAVLAAVDFTDETPTAGQVVGYHWAPSVIVTAGIGNVAGNSGADALCPNGALGSIELAEFLKQCIFIGNLVIHDGGSVQNGFVGFFSSPTRWGQLIIHNESGDKMEDDDVEQHTVFLPQVDASIPL